MKTVKPGESILVRVFLDDTLEDSEALAPELLFADFVRALRGDYKIELVKEEDVKPQDVVDLLNIDRRRIYSVISDIKDKWKNGRKEEYLAIDYAIRKFYDWLRNY